ncbi:MAG: zinc-binding dehydrogenase [Caldilineaceae bacterium]
MSTPILRTKLYIPPLRAQSIARPHLAALLNQGLQQGHKLALVSAPAGFGKSTLIAEWVHGAKRPCAWLSLDEADDQLPRFLVYVIAALQTVLPNIGVDLLPALSAAHPPAVEALLTELVNELADASAPLTLVLDDYHVIEDAAIDHALTFLLDHLPPQIHLAIVGRADPALPLARLRARRELTELRTAHLRFTSDEIGQFLHEMAGRTFTTADIAELEQRTEGWIAGLQLAALSLAEPEGYIRTFVDEGAPMARLLYAAAEQQIAPIYVGKLLAAFDADLLTAETTSQAARRRMTEELVEPLTAREIDYTKEDFTQNGQKYDLILAVGDNLPISAYRRALGPQGRYVMIGGSSMTQFFQAMLMGPWLSMTGKQKMGLMLVKPNQQDLAFVAELLATGKVVPVADKAYPFSELPDAIRYLEAGRAQGKVIINVA